MKLLYALASVGVMLTGAAQTDLRPIVEQALDQPMELKIEDLPLERAFETITEKSGVTINADPAVLELLPYGPATQVSAELRNLSLREGLHELLTPLGMTFEVTDIGVAVYPLPALERLGRPATWPELRSLQWLQGMRFEEGSAAVAELQKRVQFRVPDADPWNLLASAVKRVGAGSGDNVLEIATESLGWTWYPWGEELVVVSLADQVQRQMQAVVSIRQSHRPLTDVLRDLGRQAGIAIRLDPEAAAALPAQTRESFSLLADNVTVAEALEEVSAAAGLTYGVEAGGVVLMLPGDATTRAALATSSTPARRDPYVAKIALPDPSGSFQIEFLVRESDLSPEANALRARLLDEASVVIEEALKRRFQSEPQGK